MDKKSIIRTIFAGIAFSFGVYEDKKWASFKVFQVLSPYGEIALARCIKRIILLFLLGIALCANAQVFTHKKVVDRYDDVVLERERKTLISKNDSTIVIDEKGNDPVTYVILNVAEYNCKGNKDEIVNLVDEVFGYQECWAAVLKEDASEYASAYLRCILEPDHVKRSEEISKMIDKYTYHITHRVVTSQYTHNYLSEHVWVQKGDKNGRTIYSKY